MRNRMEMAPAYWSDMQIVDERLKKLEKDYSKLIKLLDDITKELSKINGGDGGNNGKQKEVDKSC